MNENSVLAGITTIVKRKHVPQVITHSVTECVLQVITGVIALLVITAAK